VTNLVFENKPIALHDIRKQERCPTLDSHGFMIADSPSQLQDFKSQEFVEENYLPECENLLKAIVRDADQVYCFDWRVKAFSYFQSS
jgi:hypothetical protein